MEILLIMIVLFIFFITLLNCYYKLVIYRKTQEYHIAQVTRGTWDALSFGSSYCRFGIDFSESNMNGYNLGFAAQFLYYTDKMLHQYIPFVKQGGYIFIICADLCFAEVGKGLFCANRYIHILDKKNLGDEYSHWKYITKVLFPVAFNPKLIKLVIKDIFYRLCKIQIPNPYLIDHNPHNEQQVAADANQRCNDWCKQFGLQNTQTDEIPELLKKKFDQTTKILEEMIDYCLSKGLSPILVCTPVSHHMNKLLSDQFLERVLYSNIRKANKANIPFLDYTRDPRFQNIKYYFNADMMNAYGRKKFTKILVEDIKNLEK